MLTQACSLAVGDKLLSSLHGATEQRTVAAYAQITLLSYLQLRGPARDKSAFHRPPLVQLQHSDDNDQKCIPLSKRSTAESGFGLAALNKALIS